MIFRACSPALRCRCLSLVVIATVFCLLTPVSLAQQASATVTGVVSDPTGAAVPSAQITLTNTATAVERLELALQR